MRELAEMIAKQGIGLGKDIVKVDMFLNHRIDTKLLFQIGDAFAAHFSEKKPDIVLTIEASGIAIAVAAAHAMGDLPVVFAKKSKTANQSDDVVQADVYSFTHKETNHIRVDKKYLPAGSRVLVIDDFLADGEAMRGLISLCEQTNCSVVGAGAVIEKGFQQGGAKLRAQGVDLMSLAVVKSIENGKIVLQDD